MQGTLEGAPLYRSTAHAFTVLARAEGLKASCTCVFLCLLVPSTIHGGPPSSVQISAVSPAGYVCYPQGFYRGFGAVLLGFIPAQMVYFGGYETGKVIVIA